LKPKQGRPSKISKEIVDALMQHIVYEGCALAGISYPTVWRWRQRAQKGEKGLYKRLNRIFVYLENCKLEAVRAKQIEVLRRVGPLDL